MKTKMTHRLLLLIVTIAAAPEPEARARAIPCRESVAVSIASREACAHCQPGPLPGSGCRAAA
jgi:hypothetical protein